MFSTEKENIVRIGMEALNKNVPRVLIVDDVETNRFILRDVILDMGNYPIL